MTGDRRPVDHVEKGEENHRTGLTMKRFTAKNVVLDATMEVGGW